MVASNAGAADRRRVSSAVPVVSLARLGRAASARAIMDDFRARRGAWRSRLVDGRVGLVRSGQRVAISPGVSPDAGLRDLCADRVDRAGPRAARPHRRAGAHPRQRHGASRAGHRADLSRRAGRRVARRPHLRHLAADRRQPHTGYLAAVLPHAAVAQFLREYAHGAVRSPHGGLRVVAARGAARSRRGARGEGRAGAHGRARAGVCRYAAGGARHRDADPPDAARAGVDASGHGDRGAHDRGGARGTPRMARGAGWRSADAAMRGGERTT